MKRENDKIIFESRNEEVGPITEVLSVYLEEHPESEHAPVARELLGLLDVLYMCW